jgi:iron complex outermembrane receptor protein
MRISSLTAALALTLVSLTPVAAEPVFTLDEITVTAKRFSQEQTNQGSQVRVISRRDIETSGALTLPDVLQQSAGLSVRSLYGTTPTGIELDARGYGESGNSHVLVLLDGRRLNAPDSHAVDYWSAIPLSRVERIEVQYGSGNVLYVDNAVGAVVNIVTGGRADSNRLNLVAGSYGSLQANASGGMISDTLNARLDVALARSDGYRSHSQARTASLGGHIASRPGKVETFVDFGLGDVRADLPGYLTSDQAATDPQASIAGNGQGRSERDTWHIRPGLVLKPAPGIIVQAELGYESNRLDSTLSYDMGGGFLATSKVSNDYDTWSLTPRLNLSHSLFSLPADSVFGIDLYRTDFSSSRDYFGTTRLDMAQDSRALYAQTSLRLLPETTLSLGARHQWLGQSLTRTASADLDNDQARNAWDLGISHRLAEGPRLFARIGQVFRFAKSDELTTFTGLGVALRPEHGDSAELGADWVGSKGRLQVTLYRQSLQDEIAYNANPDGDWNTYDGRNENLQRTRHTGLSLDGRYALAEGVDTLLGYALTTAEFADGPDRGKTLPLVPRHKARLGLAWRIDSAWRLDGALNWSSRQYFGSDTDNSSPRLAGYTTLDLSATWRHGPWQARISGRNLTDAHYADTGFEYLLSQYPADGRALYLSLAYTP